jgi:hypothetical protein
LDKLPSADKKKIRDEIEKVFKKYRFLKYINLEGNSLYTEEEVQNQKRFISVIDEVVSKLPGPEKTIIMRKYLSIDSEYVTSKHMYSTVFDPPISFITYNKIRNRAISKIAISLGIAET